MFYRRIPILLLFATATAAPLASRAQDYDAAVAKALAKDLVPGLPLDPVTHRFTVSAVVAGAGASAQQLYGRALDWVANEADKEVAAFQQFDPGQHKIVVQGLLSPFQATGQDYVYYTLSIYAKDGRYRYVITNLRRRRLHKVINTQTFGEDLRGPLEQSNVSGVGRDRRYHWLEVARLIRETTAQLQLAMTATRPDPSDF